MSAITNALAKALAANPDDWESRLGLIQAYLAEGNQNDARAQLADIQSLPSDEAGLILAAKCYALCGTHAREVLQPVLDANPANADAHMTMASIAHGEGDTATAMRHYITATSLDPSQSDPELDSRYGDLEKSAPPPAPSEAAVIEQPPVAATVEPEVEVDDTLEADLAPVAQVAPEPEPEVAPTPAPSAASERVEFAPRTETPAPSTAAVEMRPRREPAAPKLKLKRRSAEPSGVFYPEPGQFPTRTLRQAIEEEPAVNLEAEIEEVEAPKLNVEEAKPAPVLHTAEEAAAPEKAVWVAVDREVPSVYDYQQPDETIFEPTVTPDDIQVAATHTDDGQKVATPDMDLKAAEEKNQAVVKRKRTRDRLNAIVITILAHVGLAVLLGIISTAVVSNRPPEIIGTPGHKTPTTDLEVEEMQKQVTRQPSSVAESMPEIISSMAQSNVAISNQEFTMSDATVAFGTTFTPSMDFSASASSGDSTMLFGQKVEGKVLGVILDVSGSMAEYLPQVIREIDKNFKDAPIVFLNHALIRPTGSESEILPVVGEDVVPSRDGRTTPYWFLWGDLPRKAPQTSVDRLINIMRTRENLFLAVGGHHRVEAGVKFLIEQKIDALYMFSDFEDYVDDEKSRIMGQNLSRGKVKAYVQPAEEETEFLDIMDKNFARRSRGKRMPSLVSILRPESTDPKPIMVAEEETLPELEGVMHAAPRTNRAGTLHYEYRPSTYRGRFDELQTIEANKYDLVLCQPEARAYIFLKNDEGAYVQNPVVFSYHSQKTYW
ncbi:MAG: tetratricopeptide repeat protein [Verrucomicrobiota bacterium]